MGEQGKGFRCLAKGFQKMIRISFVGDISLNNGYQKIEKQGERPFAAIEYLFNASDFNIGNLECLCAADGVENKLKNPRLRTNEDAINLLRPLHFNMLSLAHNHIYDACEGGISCTLDKLASLSITPVGYQSDAENDPYLWKTEVKGMPLAVVTAIHKDTNPHIPENVQLNLPYYDPNRIIRAIKTAKQEKCFIAVYLHWGGKTEEGFMPDWYEIEDAHRFIDEGADVVIGSHSHTIQAFEQYKSKSIFYSLGNFCFDDVETDGKIYPIGRYRKRKGIVVTLNINEDDFHYDVHVQRIHNENCIIHPQKGRWKLLWRNARFQVLKRCKPLWKLDFQWFRKVSPIFIYLAESPDSLGAKLSKFKLNKLLSRIKS